MSSLAELRAELKNLRKSANPVPASRMKKAAVAMEIARLKGTSAAAAPPSTPEVTPRKGAPSPEKEEAAPKPVKKEKAKTVEAPKKEEAPKKTKGVKSAQEVTVPTIKDAEKKPAKGSEEMKARMAALREKRAAKKSE